MAACDPANNASCLYGTLGSGEIRLLHLYPSTGDNAVLEGRLEQCRLLQAAQKKDTDTGTFEALSYTWGGPPCAAEIVLNGVSISITPNLDAFLRQRREPENDVVLWIDALCINQSDTAERNQEVARMNLVYMCAPKLTIWLGPAQDHSTLAVEELKWLGSVTPYDKLPVLSAEVFKAIQNLFDRPWFKRTWIIQEVVFGGASFKVKKLRVHCGQDSLPWANLVVAAVRMKAHEDDFRHSVPAIDSIMELDSLRDDLGLIMSDPRAYDLRFDLLCRFRPFLSTDPRDKLYALYNMFSMVRPHSIQPHSIQPRYEATVEEVYMEFASRVLTTSADLEVLRHCASGSRDKLSWVPDWSGPLKSEPLPAKTLRRYLDVPWWAEAIKVDQDQKTSQTLSGEEPKTKVVFLHKGHSSDTHAIERSRVTRLKRLEIGAGGTGIVESFDEIPVDWEIHKLPEALKKELERTAATGRLIWSVSDDRLLSSQETDKQKQPTILRQGEIVTERRMKSWLLQKLNGNGMKLPYQAASADGRAARVKIQGTSLQIAGWMSEAVDVCHDPFVQDVMGDWKSATHLTVAIGCCKALATSHIAAQTRYGSHSGLIQVFWQTLFAGEPDAPNYISLGPLPPLRYTEWLPEIPQSWTASHPQTIVTSIGQLELAIQCQVAREVTGEMNAERNDGTSIVIDSIIEFDGLVPCDWTKEKRATLKTEMEELGALWQKQPYDLHYTPFQLFHVIPDPYREARKTATEHADSGTRDDDSYNSIMMQGLGQMDESSEAKMISDIRDRIATRASSMIPQKTLWPGLEKYVLGRRFFITKNGYLGLGPAEMQPEDRVALLLGSKVPFILRQTSTESGAKAWKLVGEAYVHGMMKGEMFGQGAPGSVQEETITIV